MRRRRKFNIVVYSELKVNIVVWPEAKVIIVVRPEAGFFEQGWNRVICVPPYKSPGRVDIVGRVDVIAKWPYACQRTSRSSRRRRKFVVIVGRVDAVGRCTVVHRADPVHRVDAASFITSNRRRTSRRIDVVAIGRVGPGVVYIASTRRRSIVDVDRRRRRGDHQ